MPTARIQLWICGIVTVFLAACGPPNTARQPQQGQSAMPAAESAAQGQPVRSNLPELGAAPELQNQTWLNTEKPLRLAELRGSVVLLDFWTFDCINCVHVIPALRQWHQDYKDQGLVVIGNHFPEFSHEHDLNNLKDAIKRLDVPYPVAQDNNGVTWTAYRTRYWPTMILIDKRGMMRYQHIGEGDYDQTEAAIQSLLAETYP
ncbi:MAG: redoxin domain-containing protein [Chloroflexi bacterium]|nr:redoxin domain-containing protein [Chloroflexota bacterium]